MLTSSNSIDIVQTLAASGSGLSLKESFEFCERLAKSHYENFPVASFFIPKEKRPYIWAIYAFARTADDFADEGNSSCEKRLERLDHWEGHLNESLSGNASHPIFIALAETIRACGIPPQLLIDLLTAFRMDVTRSRFGTFNDLLYYCKHSANPIGRLLLHVFDNANDRTMVFSDNMCTALQLTNFWQDVTSDWKKGRLYIPLEDGERFGYTEQDIEASVMDERFRKLMEFEVERTKALFVAGRPLLNEATSELQFELQLTWRGGMKILQKIQRLDYDVLHERPILSLWDKVSILSTSLLRST